VPAAGVDREVLAFRSSDHQLLSATKLCLGEHVKKLCALTEDVLRVLVQAGDGDMERVVEVERSLGIFARKLPEGWGFERVVLSASGAADGADERPEILRQALVITSIRHKVQRGLVLVESLPGH
jgi:hypothetical protein